jgi:hypothetical protein
MKLPAQQVAEPSAAKQAAEKVWTEQERSSNCSPWKLRPPLCHPERSRGICSSADLSWKCFSAERSGVESLPRRAVGSAVSFYFSRRL